ncbi:hypothetical protein CAPTEDRAFT_209641 [Capitella teleta]|uniref:ABC transmembrane type-1 domain-containing protein n=1 Tax=Capitella teleta TaxID=283909 RepID=R7VLN6_CAPTE|nr:hypothetical protein CAPTEDRAFT_209641 [Capitella teleta]|eukprot:ELU17750.1 hypothetical protein CAPTEDRAFT_209641 [Capitella teleta]
MTLSSVLDYWGLENMRSLGRRSVVSEKYRVKKERSKFWRKTADDRSMENENKDDRHGDYEDITSINEREIGRMNSLLSKHIEFARYFAFLKVHGDMSFFDDLSNSTGALGTRLASDAALVQGATGSRLAIGAISVKRATGNSKAGKRNPLEESGKVAVETIGNIRTVASLTKEEYFIEAYQQLTAALYVKKRQSAHLQGLGFGLSFRILFFCHAAIYTLGAYSITEGELEYQYMFSEMVKAKKADESF